MDLSLSRDWRFEPPYRENTDLRLGYGAAARKSNEEAYSLHKFAPQSAAFDLSAEQVDPDGLTRQEFVRLVTASSAIFVIGNGLPTDSA
jgi:hypothetical protein